MCEAHDNVSQLGQEITLWIKLKSLSVLHNELMKSEMNTCRHFSALTKLTPAAFFCGLKNII